MVDSAAQLLPEQKIGVLPENIHLSELQK